MTLSNPRPGLGILSPGSRLKSSLIPVRVTRNGRLTDKEEYRGERTIRHPKDYYYDPQSDQIVTERQYSKQSDELGIGYASKEQKTSARAAGYTTPRAYYYRALEVRTPIDTKIERTQLEMMQRYADYLTIETGDLYTVDDVAEDEDLELILDELADLLLYQRQLLEDPFTSREERQLIWLQINDLLLEIPDMDIQSFWQEVSP